MIKIGINTDAAGYAAPACNYSFKRKKSCLLYLNTSIMNTTMYLGSKTTFVCMQFAAILLENIFEN